MAGSNSSNQLSVISNQIGLLITTLLLAHTFITTSAKATESSGFFNERYRGWLWFEEERQAPWLHQEKSERQETEEQELITPEEAKAEIEHLAKELDDAKYVMLARPTPQNIKAYMEKEAIVWKNIGVLQKAW